MSRQRSQKNVKSLIPCATLFVCIMAFSQVASSQMLVTNNTVAVDETVEFSQASPWFKKLPTLSEDSLFSMGLALINSLRSAIGHELSNPTVASNHALANSDFE